MKRTLLTTVISAYFFFFFFYATGGYIYEITFGPFEAYPPFEIALYMGPLVSFGFCFCALLGAVISLERISLLSNLCLYGGTASIAVSSAVFIWLAELYTPHLETFLYNFAWLSDIGVLLIPWVVIFVICVLGFKLICWFCVAKSR